MSVRRAQQHMPTPHANVLLHDLGGLLQTRIGSAPLTALSTAAAALPLHCSLTLTAEVQEAVEEALASLHPTP